MQYFIYVIGFLLVSFFASETLSKNDPEPIGEEVSLLMFGVFSAFLGLSVNILVFRINKIKRTKPAYFFTGLFSAVVFYGALALLKIAFSGFYFVLLLAFALTLASNVVAVFIAENKA